MSHFNDDPAYASPPQPMSYAPPPPTQRSRTPLLLVVTGGLTAAFAAVALYLAQPECYPAPRPAPDTAICENHYYEGNRASCRERLERTDSYPSLTVCETSRLVPVFGVGAGVAGLAFLGLAGSAAFRRRDEITSAANSVYRNYREAAPARAEAARRTREGLKKAATATAATAGSLTATARTNYEQRRAQRDVPPPVGNSDVIYDYPESTPFENSTPIPDTPPNAPTEFVGGNHDGNDGWDF